MGRLNQASMVVMLIGVVGAAVLGMVEPINLGRLPQAAPSLAGQAPSQQAVSAIRRPSTIAKGEAR